MICSEVPPQWTVPACISRSSDQGTGPSNAQSTLNEPQPYRHRSSRRRYRPVIRSPVICRTCLGVRSNKTARDVGTSAIERTGLDSRTSPPRLSSRRIRASAIDCDPPTATGQPTACPKEVSNSPIAVLIGSDGSRMAWHETPASTDRARSSRSMSRSTSAVGQIPIIPKASVVRGSRGGKLQRIEHAVHHLLPVTRKATHHPVPTPSVGAELGCGRSHVPFEKGGLPRSQRMPEGDLRLGEAQSFAAQIQSSEGGRGKPQRMHARADIVSEAGQSELFGPNTAAGLARCLEDDDTPARLSKDDGCDQAVGSGADNDSVDLAHPRLPGIRDVMACTAEWMTALCRTLGQFRQIR